MWWILLESEMNSLTGGHFLTVDFCLLCQHLLWTLVCWKVSVEVTVPAFGEIYILELTLLIFELKGK